MSSKSIHGFTGLLSHANPKTIKGESEGYLTFILHLSPANESGFEMCQFSTRDCRMGCLNKTGHGGIFKVGETTNHVQECRKARTRYFMKDRAAFLDLLVREIERAIRYAKRRGLVPVFRLNGTSDLLWEKFAVVRHGRMYPHIFAAFADYQFYDYTKAPYDERQHDIPNYYLTFSYAETLKNHIDAAKWLANGHNVAAVFATKNASQFPATFLGLPVFNGDKSDLRFNDPKQVVIGLTVKGSLKKQLAHTSGFFIPVGQQLPVGKAA